MPFHETPQITMVNLGFSVSRLPLGATFWSKMPPGNPKKGARAKRLEKSREKCAQWSPKGSQNDTRGHQKGIKSEARDLRKVPGVPPRASGVPPWLQNRRKSMEKLQKLSNLREKKRGSDALMRAASLPALRTARFTSSRRAAARLSGVTILKAMYCQ